LKVEAHARVRIEDHLHSLANFDPS
jgi:hypothetical protein